MSLKPDGYISRLTDSVIERRMKSFGAVEVTGLKFCGKTWSSMAHAQSIVHLDDEGSRRMAELDVSLVLEGEKPHVIDEWQDVPSVWDAVRRSIDASGNQRGQYLLTGSSTVDRTRVSHSGAGRIATVPMRTMSLYESGDSTGSISLRGLFDGEFTGGAVKTDVRELARLVCRGGWPAALNDAGVVGDLPAQYLDALFSVSAVKAGVDERKARRVATSLARNTGTSMTYRTIYADANEGVVPEDVDPAFFRNELVPYLDFFSDQYFIEEQRGWDAPIKSKSRIRSKPKRTFADPSLPASLLGMSPERLLHETQTFGALFEELCLRDIRVYCTAMGEIPTPAVCYYGDADGLEVNIIVEMSDGRWGAFEVKLSEEKVPAAEGSLLRLRDKVARNPAAQNRKPSFLAVLVGKASYAWKMPSGVYVIPITELGA